MFSYRHSFHAGNHADVLKHLCQMLILEKLRSKTKPFVYIDTHSGAGRYQLSSAEAMKTAEFKDGVGRLSDYAGEESALLAYQTLVAEYLRKDMYPGSPEIARRLCRPQDKLILMEYHNQEIANLRNNLAQRQVSIHHRDGFEGLVALTPPTPARGMVLIDPPYEVSGEYQQLVQAVGDSLKRWPSGIYLIWYPLLGPRAGNKQHLSQSMLQRLAALPCKKLLCVELMVSKKQENSGMYGSGMAIINAPWMFDSQLQASLPTLSRLLALDAGAASSISWLRKED